MKKLCLLLIICAVLIISACADAKVSYELKDNNSIDIDYSLLLEKEADISNYIRMIENYWTGIGFDTSHSTGKDDTTILGEQTIRCLSREDAAEEFAKLMTEDNSLFYDATFEYAPDFREDHYTLSASVSLSDIIRQSEVQNIPPNEIDALLRDAESGKYMLSFTLPGEVAATNADVTDGNLCTWNLKYGEVTQITLETILVNDENIALYEDLQDDYQKHKKWLIVCGGVAIALVLAIIIMLIIRRVHKKSR